MPVPGPALSSISSHSCAWSIQLILGEGRMGEAINAVCKVWVRINVCETFTEGTVAVQEQLRALSNACSFSIIVFLIYMSLVCLESNINVTETDV